jgi:hypothetical protein
MILFSKAMFRQGFAWYGKSRSRMAASSVALAKDENVMWANPSLFASLCDLRVKIFWKAGCITPGESKMVRFPTSLWRGFTPPLAGCSIPLKN